MKNYKELIVENVNDLSTTYNAMNELTRESILISFLEKEPHLTAELIYKNILSIILKHQNIDMYPMDLHNKYKTIMSILDESISEHIEEIIENYKLLIKKQLSPRISVLDKIKKMIFNLDFWSNSAKVNSDKFK